MGPGERDAQYLALLMWGPRKSVDRITRAVGARGTPMPGSWIEPGRTTASQAIAIGIGCVVAGCEGGVDRGGSGGGGGAESGSVVASPGCWIRVLRARGSMGTDVPWASMMIEG